MCFISPIAEAVPSWRMFHESQKVEGRVCPPQWYTDLFIKHLHINRQNLGRAPLRKGGSPCAENLFSRFAFFKLWVPITLGMYKQEVNSQPGFLLTY